MFWEAQQKIKQRKAKQIIVESVVLLVSLFKKKDKLSFNLTPLSDTVKQPCINKNYMNICLLLFLPVICYVFSEFYLKLAPGDLACHPNHFSFLKGHI